MKKFLLIFGFILLVSSCASVKKHNEQIAKLHAVEDLREDVDKLYHQLQKHHPKLYQYTPKSAMDFKFDSLKQSIKVPMNSRDFYRKLAPVLTNVRQGHVSVRPPGKQFKRKERKVLKEKKFEFYDLDFEYVDGKLLVERTVGKDSSFVGAEVIEIAGEPASKLVETYKTRFASDGFNTTLHDRFVSKAFRAFYVRDKGFLDSLEVTFKTKDSVFFKMFKRIPKKEKKKIDSTAIKNDSIKKPKPKKLTRQQKDSLKTAAKKRKKYNKKHGYISRTKEYTRNFSFIGKDSTVVYMKIRGFSNGNYKKFYEESFKKIDSANAKHFILDLRDNGGGRISEIERLYSYLTDKEFQFITESEVNSRLPILKSIMSNTTPTGVKILSGVLSPILIVQNLLRVKKRDGTLYYKFKYAKPEAPNPLNFKGKVYVLINGNSFSASSIISTNLHATKRATFVGEETGGAYNGTVAGFYKLYELPNSKLATRIGLMQIEAPYKQEPNGYGIKPDVEILPTIQDIQEQRDPELDWILNDIQKSKNRSN
ncbi:peptidase S41 [Hyunsoonleella flava]|uniref:Peptidase S41 n=1 Tax=Hyunsoonleella flava TaxID=2527939 RepID=A0A4Q9FAC3_9FLAO|nr:S41 family peptidase [Hyunsoonleella flava]TBM99738.1 peptidase S41 [Hyunsoonleella flava]